VGLFAWLFGKKETQGTATGEQEGTPANGAPATATAASPREEPRPTPPREAPAPAPAKAATPPSPPPPPSEADNLRRWKESGQPRAWVAARKGEWNHGDWLALLDELRRSPYWPMQPEEIGRVLEETKRHWLQRN
jgi:hypothetical protein